MKSTLTILFIASAFLTGCRKEKPKQDLHEDFRNALEKWVETTRVPVMAYQGSNGEFVAFYNPDPTNVSNFNNNHRSSQVMSPTFHDRFKKEESK